MGNHNPVHFVAGHGNLGHPKAKSHKLTLRISLFDKRQLLIQREFPLFHYHPEK